MFDTTELQKKCIDVSYWQGDISVDNWKKIKKTCGYAIIRASYTSQSKFSLNKDSKFVNNFKNAKAAGLKVGAYHYSQALTVEEAKKEAEYLCNILKDSTPTYFVAIDYEYGGRLNSGSAGKASAVANAFCDVIKSHGYKPLIYANTSTLQSKLKDPKYPVWVAQYASKCTYKGSKVLWQYTSSGKVDGISGKVDLSYIYETEDEKNPGGDSQKKVQNSNKEEKKGYSGNFPSLNTNSKIVNGLAYRYCYSYGTSEKTYKYNGGKPRDAYKKAIDEAYPNHKNWKNARQKNGACCDIFTGTVLWHVGVKVKKDLKDQLVDMPKMTNQLKSNGHYLAKQFELGDVVQRGREDKSGHTWVVFETVKGTKYIANAHYKKLKGTYAVMDAKPANIVKSKWKYYKCYTVQGAVRTDYRKGDYGYDVLYIQRFLNWYGIKLVEDGDFLSETEEAVKTYQKKRNLNITGIVDDKTIEDMKAVRK